MGRLPYEKQCELAYQIYEACSLASGCEFDGSSAKPVARMTESSGHSCLIA